MAKIFTQLPEELYEYRIDEYSAMERQNPTHWWGFRYKLNVVVEHCICIEL